MKKLAWLGLAVLAVGQSELGAAEPRVLCDPLDPVNRCPGPDCVCVPDTLEIVFDSTSSSLYEYPADQEFPSAGIAVTVYMNTKSEGCSGWSYGVEHDPEALDLLYWTYNGTDAARLNPLIIDFDFQRAVEKCVPGTQCRKNVPGERTEGSGWIDSLVFLWGPVYLPVGEKLSLAKAVYVLKKDVGGAGTKIEFSNQLAWKDSPPAELGLTVNARWRVWSEVTDAIIRRGGGGGDEEQPFVRGDANDDGTVNLADAIWILNELFGGGPKTRCQDAADANDDGAVNSGDAAHVIRWLLLGGPGPRAPSGTCGPDLEPDALSCPKGSVAGCPFQ